MCGRYILSQEPHKIYGRYHLTKKASNQIKLGPLYNISPGMLVPIIVPAEPAGEEKSWQLEIMKWGLVPYWAKDPKIGYRLINTRAETINQKPSFKKSFKSKRCLIPSDGFYEWKKVNDEKVPYLIKLKSSEIFSLAGIFDIWYDAENKPFKTFSIITTKANSLVEEIHGRMPVILDRKAEKGWLDRDSSTRNLLELLRPYNPQKMATYTVSQKVNSPQNQGAELIEKVDYNF